MKWHWDEKLQTWLTGEQSCGCGVYENENGEWGGTVIVGNSIAFVESCKTREEAMEKAELLFNEHNHD